jgi:hypothetical protein
MLLLEPRGGGKERCRAALMLVAELLAIDSEPAPLPDDADDVNPMVDQLVGPLVSAPSAPPRLWVVLGAA